MKYFIENYEQLLSWLTKGCKPREDWRIVPNMRNFTFVFTLEAVPFAGRKGY